MFYQKYRQVAFLFQWIRLNDDELYYKERHPGIYSLKSFFYIKTAILSFRGCKKINLTICRKNRDLILGPTTRSIPSGM